MSAGVCSGTTAVYPKRGAAFQRTMPHCVTLSRHRARRSVLATRRGMDSCHGPVCHPVRRALSRNSAMIVATGIMATDQVLDRRDGDDAAAADHVCVLSF